MGLEGHLAEAGPAEAGAAACEAGVVPKQVGPAPAVGALVGPAVPELVRPAGADAEDQAEPLHAGEVQGPLAAEEQQLVGPDADGKNGR